MISPFFTGGKDPGKISFQPLVLAGLVAKIPSFHPGYADLIPEQGIKISLHATIVCCLSDITLTGVSPSCAGGAARWCSYRHQLLLALSLPAEIRNYWASPVESP